MARVARGFVEGQNLGHFDPTATSASSSCGSIRGVSASSPTVIEKQAIRLARPSSVPFSTSAWPPLVALASIALGLGFRVYVISLPIETLTSRYLADDYFYYLNVAHHIAHGRGSTFDVWTAIMGSNRKARSMRFASHVS